MITRHFISLPLQAAKRMELKKGKAAVRKAEKKAQAEAKPPPLEEAGVDEAGNALEVHVLTSALKSLCGLV